MRAAETRKKRATIDDLLALPEDGRGWEILDGELVEKESSGEHAEAQLRLGQLLGPYHRRPGAPGGPGGWRFASECLLDFQPDSLRPDVAGWRRERLPEGPRGTVVKVIPDWICEVVSPGNQSNDTVRKKRIYHRHKVAHYWLLDPIGRSLQVMRWTPDGYTEVLSAVGAERVRPEPFDAVELSVDLLLDEAE